MDEQLLKITMMIRMLKRQSEKIRKQQKRYSEMAKKSISASDFERAKVYAFQSIKHKSMSLRYLNLSMRMEIVEAMAKSALDSGMVTEGVESIIKSVTKVADPTFIINGISRFEKLFDDLSISSGTMDSTLDGTGGLMSSAENLEVENMLEQLAQEAATLKDEALPVLSRPPGDLKSSTPTIERSRS